MGLAFRATQAGDWPEQLEEIEQRVALVGFGDPRESGGLTCSEREAEARDQWFKPSLGRGGLCPWSMWLLKMLSGEVLAAALGTRHTG